MTFNFMKFILLTFLIVSCSKQQIIVVRGLPGAGKSTFAKEYTKTHANFVHIEKDILRKEVFKEKWQENILSRDSEIVIMHLQFERILQNLQNGKNIIVANTHLDDRHIPVFYELAKTFNAQLIIHDLRSVPLETCIERDSKRDVQSIISITGLSKKYLTH